MDILWWILIFIAVMVWIAIAFWPARVAGRKGHSFLGYFIFSLFFFPAALLAAYLIHDRTQVPPTPAAVREPPARLGHGWPGADTVFSPTGVSAIKWWAKLLMITAAAVSLGSGARS